jgi:TonB family protein
MRAGPTGNSFERMIKMMTKRRLLTAVFCTLALLTNGASALLAQTQQKMRQPAPPPPAQDVLIPREGMLPPPPSDGFFEMRIAPGAPGDSFNFSFMSSEMHFDSKIVKGAPYSAEAITESVQTLADGNRITRTSKASVYRDGEGRTRRDQTLNHIGPWATADDAPQTIFINDPVAGKNYTLNPRTRTALRTSYGFFYSTDRSGAPDNQRIMIMPGAKEGVMLSLPRDGEAPPQLFMRSEGGATTITSAPSKASPLQGGRLANKAIKSVPPTYPAIAKAAGAQGPVTVQIVVNEAGDVESAKAISGHPLLQQAGVDAARQWKFTPTELSGNRVKVSGMISFVFTLPKGEESPAAETSIMRVPASGHAEDGDGPARIARPKPVTESLGKQIIEGVEAEGTRTTITLPAGMMGNERPINIVSERWYSPELQTVLMTRHSDPRFGETSYRLTNINRSEPTSTLFEVPSDYTLKAEESHPRSLRMMAPSPAKVRQQQ